MTSTTSYIVFNNAIGNPSQTGCLHNYTTYVGHGAGTQISANNIGPGAVGYNNNRGASAGGFNSGYGSGAMNSRNCEANHVGGGSSGRFTGGEYFFCKFSDGYDEKRFEEIFREYGPVSRIHIPNRNDKYGNRFSFVTFLEVPDEEGLEKLDKSSEFRVNRARPRRSTIRNRMKTEGNMRVGNSSSSKAVDARKSFATGFSGRIWVLRQRHDAVEIDKTKKIFVFKTEKDEKDWLDFCAVGRLREPEGTLPTLRKNLGDHGFTFCEATHMGGDHVLLKCRNNCDLSTLIIKGRKLLEHHFRSVKPWSPKICEETQERYAYLRFEGVPLHAWSERFFREAVDHMRGGFISMDDSASNKTQLDVARVLITTTSEDKISETLTPRIDSNDYNVRVIEEILGNSAPVDSDWDISVDDGKVVDGRLDEGQSNGDSTDKVGCQEIVIESESHRNQHGLGSQNVVSSTYTLNAGAKPFWPTKTLNAEAKPFWQEVSDEKESRVVSGLEGELSDGNLGKGDERERREEEIFTRNRRSEFNRNIECDVQTAQQTCSLGSKQDGCREGDGEIGSTDKGSQEIVKSEPQKDHPGESGSQNCGLDTSRTIGNGDTDGAILEI